MCAFGFGSADTESGAACYARQPIQDSKRLQDVYVRNSIQVN